MSMMFQWTVNTNKCCLFYVWFCMIQLWLYAMIVNMGLWKIMIKLIIYKFKAERFKGQRVSAWTWTNMIAAHVNTLQTNLCVVNYTRELSFPACFAYDSQLWNGTLCPGALWTSGGFKQGGTQQETPWRLIYWPGMFPQHGNGLSSDYRLSVDYSTASADGCYYSGVNNHRWL